MSDTQNRGIVTISKRAAAQLAGRIAAECSGVECLTDRSKKDEVSRFLNGGQKGVYITSAKGGLSMEIYVICSFGTNGPEISKTISERIRTELGKTGIRIKNVTVRIAGIKSHK